MPLANTDPAFDFRTAGFGEVMGFERLEWGPGHAKLACDLKPYHKNPLGIVHGAVLMALLDVTGWLAGAWVGDPNKRRSAVTANLSSNFVGQAKEGRIIATSKVMREGKTLYYSQTEIHDEAGELLAYGSSSYRIRPPAKPAG